MSQGRTPDTASLFNLSRDYCDRELPATSIYRLLYEQGDALFPDEYFADLYETRGRRSVPPRVLATVMVLQRLGGLSDRDAVEAFQYDARWKYACGGLDPDYPAFVHTVLVSMRARLRKSDAPTRIFDAVLGVAKEAGLVGERRVLDSTPLYDAVATQDTVTLIRSAIRGVLNAAGAATAGVRGVLKRSDSYATPGKPIIDWDDAEAREELVDALARDGYAVLAFFDGEALPSKLDEAVRLLATVLGQDLEEDDHGSFRIARRVARDRVISTVDPETRHGHKTVSNRFDGYKGHIAIDPDSELITATITTPGNVGDAEVAEKLLADVLSGAKVAASNEAAPKTDVAEEEAQDEGPVERRGVFGRLAQLVVSTFATLTGGRRQASGADSSTPEESATHAAEPQVEVYGDAAYGAAAVLKLLDNAGVAVYTRVQKPASIGGRYSQAEFNIDIHAGTVMCPAGITAELRSRDDGSGTARFGHNCSECPLRENCTTAKTGRSVNVHAEFERLSHHRHAQQDPAWAAAYKATRPKVERKFGHMMRRRHGGRRARVRGTKRVGLDFSLLAAAINLKRLAQMGVMRGADGWGVPA